MNRLFVAMLLSVAACPALAVAPVASRPDDPPAKSPAELQGTWKLVSMEVTGKDREPLGGGSPRWVIKDNTISYGGEEIAKFTADASTSPRVIDLKYREPERAYEGIYAVEKDTLKVCINRKADGAKNRPDKFTTKDQDDWLILVFEREKAAPANATDGLSGYVGVRLRGNDDGKEVVVDSPIKDSPADKAGLKAGDVILKVGDKAATDLQAAVNAVREAKPGSKIDIRVNRDGKESTITVKAGVLPFHWVAGLE